MTGNRPTREESDRWLLERIEGHMRALAASPEDTPVGAVLRDALGTPGKMLRPQLVWNCSFLGLEAVEKIDRLCLLAAMVELTHLSSLIHDDIIDDAPLRRGNPSIQAKYGKDAAVYAGDLLIARIQYTLAKEGMNRASMRLAKTVEEMCVGEIGQARCRFRTDVTAEEYYDNIKGKTASLFKCACVIGAEEAEGGEETLRLLEEIGERIGILFQLRDDLTDFTATQTQAGKPTHKDLRDGIYTLPVLKTLEDTAGREELLPLLEANRQRGLSAGEVERVEEIVLRHGGVERTWKDIHKIASQAYQKLEQLAELKELKEVEKRRDMTVRPLLGQLKGVLEQLDERKA